MEQQPPECACGVRKDACEVRKEVIAEAAEATWEKGAHH